MTYADYFGISELTYSCCPQDLAGTGNITADPLFVDHAHFDLNLQPGSPCIDTGDPSSPLDPDNTRADMGALYFDQGGTTPDFVVDLTYVSGSPVPSSGGSVFFDLYVLNDSGEPQDYDGWLAVEYEGNPPVTLVLRSFTGFQPGWAINRHDMFYPVPSNWAAGNYDLCVRVGDEPDVIWAEDSFPFVKSGAAGALDFQPLPAIDAPNPFACIEKNNAAAISGHHLLSNYPNPFNPATTVRYTLRQAGPVSLAVYDITGKQVAHMMDGWQPAGSHEISFDGSNLATGVYLLQLRAGEYEETLKLVLMK